MTWRLPPGPEAVRLASMSKVASGEKIFMVTSLWVKSAALLAHVRAWSRLPVSLKPGKWAGTCYHKASEKRCHLYLWHDLGLLWYHRRPLSGALHVASLSHSMDPLSVNPIPCACRAWRRCLFIGSVLIPPPSRRVLWGPGHHPACFIAGAAPGASGSFWQGVSRPVRPCALRSCRMQRGHRRCPRAALA
jgi:hypothetical protein